jgi:5,10-methylenetetrahydrofolate reductase
MHIEFNAKFDGKDYPASGVPWADMVSVKRIDTHTVQVIQKKGGQVMMTITCEVPPMERYTRAC